MMNGFSTPDVMGALQLTWQGRLKAAVSVLLGKRAAQPSVGSVADAMEKLQRLSRSPLLQGLPGLGPKRPQLQQSGVARFEQRRFTNDAGSRDYKLFVPACYKGQALPLVLMLHGCTQSPDDFAAGTRMNEIAEEKGFFVAYPAQNRSANITKCWNWFSVEDQQRDLGEPSIIAGITRQIMDEFSVRSNKVYVAGLSAGGAAAANMGAAYPDLFAAIGVHSGLCSGAASDLTSAMLAMRRGAAVPVNRGSAAPGTLPTIVFHGDRDSTVNIANAAQVIAQSKGTAKLHSKVIEGETSGMAYTRTVQSTDYGRPVLEEWVLHGAGHAWSGGSNAGSYTQPDGPDASREMVRFFLQQ